MNEIAPAALRIWSKSPFALAILLAVVPVCSWAQPRPGAGVLVTNQIYLSPASSRADIELRLKQLREQEDALFREERVLQSEIRQIEQGIRDYLTATNSIEDPDILAFKKQIDEIEARYRALSSALNSKLQESPRFRGQLQMKRAASFRLQQIEKTVGGLREEQKLLRDRLDVSAKR